MRSRVSKRLFRRALVDASLLVSAGVGLTYLACGRSADTEQEERGGVRTPEVANTPVVSVNPADASLSDAEAGTVGTFYSPWLDWP